MEYTDPLTKLYVEITTTCNLDCEMCVRRAWHEPLGSMPRATFQSLMDQLGAFSAPPAVHLGGYGEPMSHPDFVEIVRLAKDAGARIEVTTNGTLLDTDVAAALVDLDLDRLVVSIDSVSPASYEDIRHHASFEQVVENVVQLRRLKLQHRGRRGNPKIGIAFVAMQRNVADLTELPRLATRIGASEILVSNLIPHTAEMQDEILYEHSLRACTYRGSPWVPDMSLPKLDLNAHTLTPVHDAFNSIASLSLLDVSLSGRNDYCHFGQRGYAAIRWDGEVSPCLSLLHDHPEYLRGRRRDLTHYSLGNVNDTPLRQIWQAPEFAAFRSKLREFPFSPCTTCGGCERFPENFEDCTRNTFPTCGGCLWSQGFIQCP